MSLLGKYRKEAEKEEPSVEEEKKPRTRTKKTKEKSESKTDTVPNSERRSPIMSFSVATDLRSCLQAIREEHAINLSMWVERRLREAVEEHYPSMAKKYLE